MLVDEIWDFKSINMGRELEIAGEFIYDSAKKMMSITGLHNQYEISTILYTGAVGIERLQKIYLCLVQQDPTDQDAMPKCLMKHNHLELEKEIEKHTQESISKNEKSLLGVFADYYQNFRYANYIPGRHEDEMRKLFIGFLRKQNGKFDFDEPFVSVQFDEFKRFYINVLGKLANYYFERIENKAREIGTYTYEIDSFSNACRVFWSAQRRTLYTQMLMEEEAIKEMILYIYKNKSKFGVFQVFNEMEALDLDDVLINEYLADLCEGKVNESLIDYVEDLYEEIEDVKQMKSRRNLLSLIGNREVYFDWGED